jgi:hypothetical protein
MIIAIKNLYSSSVENEWHRKNGFKFATPDFLLKDDNMNQYLNVSRSVVNKTNRLN